MKYYYIGSIEPLWMAHAFCMRFTDKDGEEIIRIEHYNETIWIYSKKYKHRILEYVDNCFFIHPDSEHLLRPRNQDIILTGYDKIFSWPTKRISKWMDHYKILSRQRILFFWPFSKKLD